MSLEHYRYGEWYYSIPHQAYFYLPPGDYKVGESPDLTKCTKITREEFDDLIEYIKKRRPEGILHTDRTEDLKIIHRLIDTIQGKKTEENKQ